MAGTKVQDDIFQQLAAMERRVKRLENSKVEDVHYIGDPDDPIAPSFQGTWVHNDNGLVTPGPAPSRNVGFWIDGDIVRLTGVAKSGTSGTAAFTLPEGYRPGTSDHTSYVVAYHTATTTNAPGLCSVSNLGVVTLSSLTSTGSNVSVFCFLDDVWFRAGF